MPLLYPTEVPLYVPFQYESKNPFETYMIIGTIKQKMGYNIVCLILDRQGFVYCDELPEIDFVKPASNRREFVKAMIGKNMWDSEDPQYVSFSLALGNDHRDPTKIKRF